MFTTLLSADADVYFSIQIDDVASQISPFSIHMELKNFSIRLSYKQFLLDSNLNTSIIVSEKFEKIEKMDNSNCV